MGRTCGWAEIFSPAARKVSTTPFTSGASGRRWSDQSFRFVRNPTAPGYRHANSNVLQRGFQRSACITRATKTVSTSGDWAAFQASACSARRYQSLILSSIAPLMAEVGMSVKSIAIPCSSAAAITSSHGWNRQAGLRRSRPQRRRHHTVAEREERVRSHRGTFHFQASSAALIPAIFAEYTRLIWPRQYRWSYCFWHRR